MAKGKGDKAASNDGERTLARDLARKDWLANIRNGDLDGSAMILEYLRECLLLAVILPYLAVCDMGWQTWVW